MARGKIWVRVQLKDLHCLQEGDGWGSGEPYLWAIAFRIDGSSLRQETVKVNDQEKYYLRGNVDFWFSRGSHGNLWDDDVDAGDTIPIPGMVWNTSLQSIPVVVGGRSVELPGTLGVLTVLLDEGNVSNRAVEAGHQVLNEQISAGIQDFVSGLELGEVAFAAGMLAAQRIGKPIDQLTDTEVTDAAIEVVRERFDELRKALEGDTSSAVESRIKDKLNILEKVAALVNPDTAIGTGTTIVSQKELIDQGTTGVQFRDQNHSEAAEGNRYPFSEDLLEEPDGSLSGGGLGDKPAHYILDGSFGWERRFVVKHTREPDSDRARIDCSETVFSTTLDSKVLWYVGGIENGKRWRLHRLQVYDLIRAEKKSFYVRGSDGVDVAVLAGIHEVTHHPYIRTEGDQTSENNLWALPTCPPLDEFVPDDS